VEQVLQEEEVYITAVNTGDQDKEIVVVEEQKEIPMDHTFGPYEDAPKDTSPKSNHRNDQVVTLGETEYTEDYLEL